MGSRLRACAPYFALLLVAVALYAAALRIDVPPSGGGRIGPDFWPKAIIVFMSLLCVWEIVRRLVVGTAEPADRSAGATDAAQIGDEGGTAESALDLPMLLGGAAAIVGYVIAVDWLGFFASTLLFLFAFAWIGGFRRIVWNLGIAVGGSLLTLVLFMRVAYISLPLGEGPLRSLSLALLRLIGVS
jgi:hypothetical protein